MSKEEHNNEAAVEVAYYQVLKDVRVLCDRLEKSLDDALIQSAELLRMEGELRTLVEFVQAARVLLSLKMPPATATKAREELDCKPERAEGAEEGRA